MSCLINFSYRLIQYYGILYGFSYAYYDIANHMVKYFKYIKYYVYFINLLYAALALYFLENYIAILINNIQDPVMEYMYIISYITNMFILTFLIRLRWKERDILEKWQPIYSELQIKYFPRLICFTTNKTLELIRIFNILIIFPQICYTIFRVIFHVKNKEWYDLMQCCLANYFLAMSNYIMLRHSFILCYIYNCFMKISKLLKTEGTNKSLIYIYYKLSLLMQEMNAINGSIILSVFIYQVIEIAIHIQIFFDMLLIIDFLDSTGYVDVFVIIMMPLNICLYFFICDRLYRNTSHENVKIFMEYAVGKKNQKVCEIFSKAILFYFYFFFKTD